jgi:hypothetical protein
MICATSPQGSSAPPPPCKEREVDSVPGNPTAVSAPPKATISADMRAVLQQSYDACAYPSRVTRLMLADQLGISAHSVKIWFQNRRCRDRTTTAVADMRDAMLRRAIEHKERVFVETLRREQRMQEAKMKRAQAPPPTKVRANVPTRKAESARRGRERHKQYVAELQEEVTGLRARAAELEALRRAQSYAVLVRELDAVLTPEQMRTLVQWCERA